MVSFVLGNLHGSLFSTFNANIIEANIGCLLSFAIVSALIGWRKDGEKGVFLKHYGSSCWSA